MPNYVFRRDDPRMASLNNASTLSAQKIGNALAKLKDRTPPTIVQVARDPTNAMHMAFEWSDDIAAAKFRLDQARTLCQVVRIASTEIEDETTPAFVSIKLDDGDGRRYFSKREILKSKDLQLLLLTQAERDLEAFEARYAELKTFCVRISEVRKDLKRHRQGLEGGDRPSA